MLHCPYSDPNGIPIKDTIKCRECYFADREIPSQFKDLNGSVKRALPPQKALADREEVGSGGGSPWPMTREERRLRIAERYGVYSDRDVPGYDPACQTISQALASANDTRSSRKKYEPRLGGSRDYGGNFAYEHPGAQAATQFRAQTPPPAPPAATATENPKSREKLTWLDSFWEAVKPKGRNGLDPLDPNHPPSYSAAAMKLRSRGAKPGDPPPETDPKLRTFRDIA